MIIMAIWTIVLSAVLFYFVKCDCPINYTQSDVFCYKFPSLQMDWTNATAFCTQDGGSMAVISSAQENTAYANFRNTLPITGDPVWIGIHFVVDKWQFLTDYTGGSTIYLNFVNGTIPLGQDGDCIIGYFVDTDFVWTSVHCNVSLYFICEARATNIVTTSITPVVDMGSTNVSASSNWIKVYNNYRFDSLDNSVQTNVRSVVFCAVLCAQSNLCLAFNHRADDNQCQLIQHEVNSTTVGLMVSTGWDVWIDGSLL